MCVVINQFLSPSNLCDMPRFHCATCSGLPVRLAPVLLCDLLRIMQVALGVSILAVFSSFAYDAQMETSA